MASIAVLPKRNISGPYRRRFPLTLIILLLFVICARHIALGSENIHIWRSTDTLEAVARQYGISPFQLRHANGIIDPADLTAGKKLIIPKSSRVFSTRKAYPQIHRRTPKKITFAWPAKGKITSGFGMRRGRPHNGIDINRSKGSTIYAAAAGKVIYADWKKGYGRTIIINHNNGYKTLYAHNHRHFVKKGQWVQQGQNIALMGDSGRSNGIHLHFEILYRGKALNPMRLLPER